jgi:flagellar biosynthesis/type III secretory pathway protein FliH
MAAGEGAVQQARAVGQGELRPWLPAAAAPASGPCRPAPWAVAGAPPERPIPQGPVALQWEDLLLPPPAPPVEESAAEGVSDTPADGAPPDPVAAAAQEADGLLAAARAEAAAILAAARAEAAEEQRRARRAGWEDGQRAARAEWSALLGGAVRLRRRAREARQGLLRSLTRDVATLAAAVAARVLERELEWSADEVVALARSLVRRTEMPAVLRVRPEDAPLLEAEPLPAGVRLLPDSTLGPGDLSLESEDGVLDARVPARFAQVVAALCTGGGTDA